MPYQNISNGFVNILYQSLDARFKFLRPNTKRGQILRSRAIFYRGEQTFSFALREFSHSKRINSTTARQNCNIYGAGKVLPGLVARRKFEYLLLE